jgi:DNA polymerase
MSATRIEWCPEAAEDALTLIRTGSLDLVEDWYGDAMQAVSGCLRGLFVAAPGYDLICADYSAIEAVVIAELAGEPWRIEVFMGHGKIYEASASTTFGIPLADIIDYPSLHNGAKHPLRAKGKITELALGFLGWIGALRVMGYEGTDEEAKDLILKWRAASPNLVYFGGGQKLNWKPFMHGLEGMAIQAVMYPGQVFPVIRMDGTDSGISYVMERDVLYCYLLDGSRLVYHRPRLEQAKESWRGWQLSFEGWNTNPKMGGAGWWRMTTYSGKLLENVVQATANRIQRFSQINLERAGYPIVQHVYDENCSEIPQGWGSVEEFCEIMNRMPTWASTRGRPWPVRAPVKDAWRGRRYRK